jgi:hypothetical protein
MSPVKTPTRTALQSVIYLILVPTIAQLLFSSFGYTPTDDGYFLAYGRRVLEGMIPHRDFIAVYPILTPLLHLPSVAWGGEHTYWVSRYFVWFQLACIGWIWTFIAERMLSLSFTAFARISLALISVAASTFYFGIMAWNTIDGLFLISIGVWLCTTRRTVVATLGYALIASAYLCKQSFLFAAPLALFILGDWRRVEYWLAIAVPGGLFTLFLLLTGAFTDGIRQLASMQQVLRGALQSYYNREILLGVIAGYLSARLALGERTGEYPSRARWNGWLGLSALSVIPVIGVASTFVTDKFILQSSFGLFGMVVGAVSCCAFDRPAKSTRRIRMGLLVLMAAWCVSLSGGLLCPILASGQLLLVLWAFAYPGVIRRASPRVLHASLALCAIVLLLSFGFLRFNRTYNDQPPRNLTKELGGVLPGGTWIRTNPNTYAALIDLRRATGIALELGRTYSVFPDYAGYWVRPSRINQLPYAYAFVGVWYKPAQVRRVISELEKRRDVNIVILAKEEPSWLPYRFHPLSDRNQLAKYIREHFTKVRETSCFELYR